MASSSSQQALRTSAARHAHLGRVGVAGGARPGIRWPVGVGGATTTGHAHLRRVGVAGGAATRARRLVSIAATTAGHTYTGGVCEATAAATGIGRHVLGCCRLLQSGHEQGGNGSQAKQGHGSNSLFHAKANDGRLFYAKYA